jgi:hypothetical protein
MRALLGEMWMTTLIMLPGHLMVQGALACRDETAPTRKARGFAPCGERDCLPPEPQPGNIGKYPAGLACSVIAVSQGMAIQAAGGASREVLLRMVEMVL